MKQLVFSIHDQAAGAYMRPFFVTAVGLAVREFERLANEKEGNVSRWPDQYTLFELGTYEDSTGVLESLEIPKSHGNAVQYLSNEDNNINNVEQIKATG